MNQYKISYVFLFLLILYIVFFYYYLHKIGNQNDCENLFKF